MALITLKEWATAHSIDPATARQRAGRGAFETAVKMGRDWFIDSEEELIDHRTAEHSRRWKQMEKKTYYVVNCDGDLAGHDMDKTTAEQCLKAMQEKEPEAEWEMFDSDENEE